MIAANQSLAEITQSAIHLLCREMGVVNTIRFLNQFSTGQGDYTAERDQQAGSLSVADAVSKIRRKHKDHPPGN